MFLTKQALLDRFTDIFFFLRREKRRDESYDQLERSLTPFFDATSAVAILFRWAVEDMVRFSYEVVLTKDGALTTLACIAYVSSIEFRCCDSGFG